MPKYENLTEEWLRLSPSTLCRSPAFRHARRTFLQPVRKVVRAGPRKNGEKFE